MIKARVLSFYIATSNANSIQQKVNEVLEEISYVGYVKDIKINTTKERIIYTIIYEEA
jgi:hypothetical protein